MKEASVSAVQVYSQNRVHGLQEDRHARKGENPKREKGAAKELGCRSTVFTPQTSFWRRPWALNYLDNALLEEL
jgi:hypothetical protein